MNVHTTEGDLWKYVSQHVEHNTIVFIKKNNTCARIRFINHEYANVIRKNLDGNFFF